jgi:hypothetical protein
MATARFTDDPTQADAARVWRGLQGKLAWGAGVAVASAVGQTAWAAGAIKLAVAAVALTGLAGGTYLALRAPVAAPPAEAAAASQPAPAAIPPPVVAPREPPRTPKAATPTSGLSAETRLVRSAHAALRDKSPARALAFLDEHAQRFPSGVLRPERMAARVFALCELGQRTLAHAAAAVFLREHPRSPLAPEVRRSCTRSR